MCLESIRLLKQVIAMQSVPFYICTDEMCRVVWTGNNIDLILGSLLTVNTNRHARRDLAASSVPKIVEQAISEHKAEEDERRDRGLIEPLLRENSRRFVLYPIEHDDVSYTTLVAVLSHRNSPSRQHRNRSVMGHVQEGGSFVLDGRRD